MTPDQLLTTLRALPPAEFEAVLLRLGLSGYVPPDRAPLQERHVALARWAAAGSGNLLRLHAALKAEAAVPDPAAWTRTAAERHNLLQVLGLRTGDARYELRLDDLFIELDLLHEHAARGTRLGELEGPREDPLDDARTLTAALAAVAGKRAEFGLRGVVVVGLPGSGKTTLLHKRFVDDHRAGERTPVLLRFATLQKFDLKKLDPGDLPRWAEEEATRAGFPGAGHALLADRSRPFRFLLDGYDELVAADRPDVATWLAGQVSLWENADFVVTTRKAAWDTGDPTALSRVFAPYVLLGLRRESAETYVQRWFPVMAKREADPAASEDALKRATQAAAAQAETLIRDALRTRDVEAQVRLAPFVGNPLLLSILCLVYRQWGRLPSQRGKLYAECFEVLVRGRPRLEGGRTGFEPDTGRALLGPLAWDMQETSADIQSPKEVPKAVVLAHLRRAADANATLRGRDPEALLRTVREECGLLVAPDAEQHHFAHLTFQEYLAFEHARAETRAPVLAAHANEDRWREPILLGMSDTPFQTAFFDALLRQPGRAAANRTLLAACWREAEPGARPFVEALRRVPPPWWKRPFSSALPVLTPADLAVILGLFKGNPPADIREAAGHLCDHPDATLRALAREVAGVASVTRNTRTVDVLGMEFVWVEQGEFLMGATKQEGAEGYDPEASDGETPHRVRLTRGFWLGRFPLTNAQYRRFTQAAGAEEPASFRQPGFDDPEMPVTSVSWDDAQAYCAWATKVAGAQVLLPTEAQWEYAARGTDGRRYPWGNERPTLERCWFGAFARGADRKWGPGEHADVVKGPARVGERPGGAGPFGAEEQAGNVWEWCADVFGRYPSATVTDPTGPPNTGGGRAARVFRGGSWYVVPVWARSAFRDWGVPGYRVDFLGFRVLLPAPA